MAGKEEQSLLLSVIHGKGQGVLKKQNSSTQIPPKGHVLPESHSVYKRFELFMYCGGRIAPQEGLGDEGRKKIYNI